MISHMDTICSWLFLNTLKPSFNNVLNFLKASDSKPPNTSTYSKVNLNGAASNPTDPGELDNIKPKSM
ncbi:hypothetical protein FOG48_02786 [Hanseniaspora uvarum]|nr:hypothetical protein FOG48_02786 [Hanseniaspora uvarum]